MLAGRILSTLPLLGLVLTACGDEPRREVDVDAVGRVSTAIKDGYDDAVDTGVLVITTFSGSLCSGSLIAPNVVLTARHCVSPTSSSAVTCGATEFGALTGASSFLVSSAPVVTTGNAGEFLVEEVVGLAGLPGIPGSVDNDRDLCGNDMALLILQDNVPGSVAVPYEPRLDGPLGADLPYYAVGYGGVDGNGNESGTRRRRDELSVICDDEAGCLAVDLTDVVDGEWAGTGGVCPGDSGGPALDLEDRVVGVTSRGDDACELSIYANPAAHAQWLKDATVFASGIGMYDAPAWTAGSNVNPQHAMPVGERCDAGADCPTGICVIEETQHYCSRPCDELGPCPDGYECSGDGTTICTQIQPAPAVSYQRPPRDGCSLTGAQVASTPPRSAWVAWGLVLGLGLLGRRARR